MTGFAQVAFPHQADGSLINENGKVVGSKLAAQEFKWPRYFHERPSATAPAYNAGATDLREPRADQPRSRQERAGGGAAILKLEGPYNPGLTIDDIPVDAVTTSGSGIDPDISPAYARAAVAPDRGRAPAPARDGAEADRPATPTAARSGFFGEPGVNVLELNLALDKGDAA